MSAHHDDSHGSHSHAAPAATEVSPLGGVAPRALLIPLSLLVGLTYGVLALVRPEPVDPATLRRIPVETLRDKIRGGWVGQMVGVAYGTPTEFRALGETYEKSIEWDPRLIELAYRQDDLYVEMTFAEVMDTVGLEATTRQYGEAFKDTKYHLWHANAGARRNLNRGIAAPDSGHPKHNIHANDIDFQIEADFIGLMSPGLPRESNKYCDRVGRVMNHGDGLYGGMFVGGMYAAAYFENDLRKIVEAGLACIPAESRYAKTIVSTLAAFDAHPDDWRAGWRAVTAEWDKGDDCTDGALRPFNIDASLNGAFIAFGLLWGGGDFEKTMEISTRCGQDSDCNPASAAGVLGVVLGYEGIPTRWRDDLERHAGEKFIFTNYTLDRICESTFERAAKVARSVGGRADEREFAVPPQSPAPPALEQWDMGEPKEIVNAFDARWMWGEKWRRLMNSHHQMVGMVNPAGGGPAGEATLQFSGTAIAIVGHHGPNGGRADVLLDGEKAGEIDQYCDPNTHDNDLFHAYGLSDGAHTLTIRSRDDRDPRSEGGNLLIEGAIVYGPAAEAH